MQKELASVWLREAADIDRLVAALKKKGIL